MKSMVRYKLQKLVFLFCITLCSQVAQAQVGKNNTVSCQEKDSLLTDSEDPAQLKTCTYGKYRNKVTGIPDYKGRYSYQYELFENGKPIKNQEMFNDPQAEFIGKINSKIKLEFENLKKDPDFTDCFADVELGTFSINDLSIEFSKESLIFNYKFGLSGPCFSLDGVSVFMNWEEVGKYIKK